MTKKQLLRALAITFTGYLTKERRLLLIALLAVIVTACLLGAAVYLTEGGAGGCEPASVTAGMPCPPTPTPDGPK